MKKTFYPVVFHKEDDGGYSVSVPDIPGCNSQGDSLSEAYEMAFDAIGLCISDMVDSKGKIPVPSAPDEIKLDSGDTLVLVEFDFDRYCQKYNVKSVKKTLTIPAWLNTMAENSNINFSSVLQDALKNALHL
ncbi:MAG: type II toxin-antitoxin system HicB family antitoxin [Clostridia bacterium]|nr:type II toxin-antitoxin system HicB family antitoxin [Clostridia bacterium]